MLASPGAGSWAPLWNMSQAMDVGAASDGSIVALDVSGGSYRRLGLDGSVTSAGQFPLLKFHPTSLPPFLHGY